MQKTRFDQPGHPPATITEFEGVRSLHLGTSWVQGAMRLSKPDAIELEYVQMMMMWMLFLQQPRHIAQLGLGSAALTKFCHGRFPGARVSVAELNPNVIAVCQAMFGLPPNDDRLNVRQMDALDFVHDPANRGAIDVLQVDLYDEEARGPVLDSPEFYQACSDCLTEHGIMTANVFGEFDNYERNLQHMELAFDAVVWLPEVHDANIVAIAFKTAPVLDFSVLYERAAAIRKTFNLPARKWVDGLKEWMLDQG
ncbi:spermidine synthase [Pseudoduganella sp. SL102]|uniref:spermine/spermidine synthase domain-containing protein n=1 Tax=Pseudoduganella sp. SL102 TaxID=2995154 RepID=UPI00248B2653|nr:spermidine synthase [Pseudoduganella sp. SL102]WBS03394.1 spermidine synthase [Pseudoduganella sp. SL102]